MTPTILKGPQFVRFFQPVLDALKELGGSGRPDEVVDFIIEKLSLSEKERNEMIPSGELRLTKNVNWARFYLARAGFIDASTRGVWTLTNSGRTANLSHDAALQIFNDVHKQFSFDKKQKKVDSEKNKPNEVEVSEDVDHRTELMTILLGLSPEGFERLCQRLLRESGFEKVEITGRSGDGGIDGIGVLQVNPFVSFKVLFQCKRYKGSVVPSQVRDFRGTMQGRADKGIILTTGTFTTEAKKEASRDGVPPIELVDGDKLMDMFEKLELGVRPIQAYEVVTKFFDEYK
jgi:restriction system protein